MENFIISTDRDRLDIPMIHQFLSERSYWAKGRSLETVQASIANSLCFGVYDNFGKQLGFARVSTDYAIFAWLMDVFILEDYRGKGLGKLLIKEVTEHPALKNIRRIGLATADAHGLYQQYGFTGLSKPQNMMEILRT